MKINFIPQLLPEESLEGVPHGEHFPEIVGSHG